MSTCFPFLKRACFVFIPLIHTTLFFLQFQLLWFLCYDLNLLVTDVGASRDPSPAPASPGSSAVDLPPPAVQLPHSVAKFQTVSSKATATIASSQTAALTVTVPLLGPQLATGFVTNLPAQLQTPSVPLTPVMPSLGAQSVTGFATHRVLSQSKELSSLTISSAAPVPSQKAQTLTSFVTHRPPLFAIPSLSTASSTSSGPLHEAQPSSFVTHLVCQSQMVSVL